MQAKWGALLFLITDEFSNKGFPVGYNLQFLKTTFTSFVQLETKIYITLSFIQYEQKYR